MKHCKQEMREVGATGKNVQIVEMYPDGTGQGVVGIKTEKIYQCDKCKHIEIL